MSKTTYYAADNETLSETVCRALAATTTTPQDVQPLYESIDPEGLDALFSERSTCGRVIFDHAEYRITVHSTGKVQLKDKEKTYE